MSIQIKIGEMNFSFPKETSLSDEQIRTLIISKLKEIADTVKNGKLEISYFGDFTRLFFDEYRVNAWDAFVFVDNENCGDDDCYDPECTSDHD